MLDEDDRAPVGLADDGASADHVAFASLLDEGAGELPAEPATECCPVAVGSFRPADVGRGHDDILVLELFRHGGDEQGVRGQVLCSTPERVPERRQVVDFERHDTVYADRLEQARHVAGEGGIARLRPALLARVAEERNDGGDAARGSVPKSSQEEQQATELVVDALSGIPMQRLDD